MIMAADCRSNGNNYVWRVSQSRDLRTKINEQDRSSIELGNKSRCSDRYFGVFFYITVAITQIETLNAKHTIMRFGRILGPVGSFFDTPFSFLMRHTRMTHGT